MQIIAARRRWSARLARRRTRKSPTATTATAAPNNGFAPAFRSRSHCAFSVHPASKPRNRSPLSPARRRAPAILSADRRAPCRSDWADAAFPTFGASAATPSADRDRVMHPAVPIGRHARGFGEAIINHIAALAALPGSARRSSIIAVALLVFAHENPAPADIEQRAQSRAVPPGKNAVRAWAFVCLRRAVIAAVRRPV